jgi:hypothetical protein
MKSKVLGLAVLVKMVMVCSCMLLAQNVVTDWTAIASTTIVKNAGNAPAAGSVYFAYAAIATYDAVNAFHHRFQPFYYSGSAPLGASKEAAAVAAAHCVLVNYFPSQQTTLDGEFDASLAAIQASDNAKAAGLAVGEASAAALIAARTGDGLQANVPYTPGSGPGVWQPTPPKFLPGATPWLGQMRPFTMSSASQFLPDGPTPLSSRAWKRDYDLTRRLGRVDSTSRTPAQTEIGIFWTENTAQQYARVFTYLASNYHLNLLQTARMMAVLWTATADAGIGCFNAKYQYSFWRPVTAIPMGGGNPDLTADAGWLPLGTTPNHPEYPAAHACLTGAVTPAVEGYFGTPKVHVVVDSLAFTDGVHTHTFESTHDWFNEVFWARIYAGFHFYHSLVDGGRLGNRVAQQLEREYFQPVEDDGRR